MWDDALATDFRLMELLRSLGCTANFAIAPNRHGENRKPNDVRGDYGDIVSKKELKEFADFEISNHTANHVDLTVVPINEMKQEVIDGQKSLEDIFQRQINGFCFPYGQYNQDIIDFLKKDYLYARTTRCIKNGRLPLLHPTAKWDVEVDNLLNCNDNLVFWGHTYELTNEESWETVKRLYERLSQDPQVKIVSFTEMVNK